LDFELEEQEAASCHARYRFRCLRRRRGS
jgi:hypothetical protein